jgi:hypothetical protein
MSAAPVRPEVRLRGLLPGATALGLIVHRSEHTSRHTWQFMTTLEIARGLRAAPAP